jgi:hypothetical protein
MAQFLITTGARFATAWIANAAQRQIASLFAEDDHGPRTAELQIQTSTEGASIPMVYGRMRLTGQLIWAARFKETSITRSSGGGKGGGPKTTEYRYSVSFAVGLCEGEIGGVGRIWADGSLLALNGANWRVHTGKDDQAPDPLIQAIEGAAGTPAYRGLAYVVFEDLPLESFGDRIPNLSFEVIAPPSRDPGAMEQKVKAVCLIPSSGEFTYADRAVMREGGEGIEYPENHHTTRAGCDMDAALDDLQARLPRCGSVALVTAWFGDDLRASHCTLTPRVEIATKETHPLTWSAAGLSRSQARTVTVEGGSPVYGGTPSDESVIQAIKGLKARGLDVTLYPFILMDIPSGNGLPDPYGGAAQAVFPWRGRITCHPAPEQAGSPDKTSAATAQIDAFFGTAQASDFTVFGETVSYSGPDEWSFNRFILHHAALAKAAGGVESFIIGSEMRALTQVRDSPNSYPAVQKLVALAAQVRSLLGPSVKLSYAADWSEYFGHAPSDGSGDRLFHLDPLWASPSIDFIGIDWYAPLSDWRDGEAHADRLVGAASIYDPAYLTGQVEGGEGYDWYYASAADRESQTRTAITDGAHNEPWVWRYKDLRNWWANPHHDRIGGVRQSQASEWIPQSKPVRLVELGCPAVDKGANQPNVFIDPKSSESTAPYHSSGARDDLIQRRYIEALLGYWDGAANPVSTVYGGPMLDLAHSHVWTWDARPFPEFPAREDVWTDGPNWRRGHWLTGRAGQSLVGDIVADIAARAGLDTLDTTQIDGVLAGYTVSAGARARDEIDRLGAVFGFDVVDRASGPVCVSHSGSEAPTGLRVDALAVERDGGGPAFSREPDDALPVEVRVQFQADDGDYGPASASAHGLDHATQGFIDLRLTALCDRDIASGWAQDALARARAEGEGARLRLPPSQAALEAGDLVLLDAGPEGRAWRLAAADGVSDRNCDLVSAVRTNAAVAGPEPGYVAAPRPPSRPALILLDLPLRPGGEPRSGFWVTGWADPWPGPVTVFAGVDVATAQARAEITAPSWTGTLTAPLKAGFEGRWDIGATAMVRLNAGGLSSTSEADVLNGANRLAVETEAGWEVLAFTTATLVEGGIWALSGLLRGLGGTPVGGAGTGARVVVLDEAGAVLPVKDHEVDAGLTVLAVPPGKALNDSAVRRVDAVYQAVEQRPLAPVHLTALWNGSDIQLRWIRRARIDADAWGYGDVALDEAREAYELVLMDGDTVVRTVEVGGGGYSLTEADRLTLFPNGLESVRFKVAQISDVRGAGRWAEAQLAPAN